MNTKRLTQQQIDDMIWNIYPDLSSTGMTYGRWTDDTIDYDEQLDNIPLEHIERYLRRKKLERIDEDRK